MGDFLKVNGIVVPMLAEAGFGLEPPILVGEQSRASDGSLVRDVIAWKDVWRGRAAHQLADGAIALRELIRGNGHHASWNSNLYTSKGKPPNSTTGLSIDTSSPKLGAGNLRIAPNAAPYAAVYALSLGTRWTIEVWRRLGAGSWESYVVTSDGRKWVNGARNDAASTAWLGVSSGTVTLSGDAASTVDYDDGVFLPFEIPTDWGAVYHSEGTAGREFSDLPKLTVSGDAIQGGVGVRTVIGVPGQMELVPAALSGAWRSNVHTFEFTLEEA